MKRIFSLILAIALALASITIFSGCNEEPKDLYFTQKSDGTYMLSQCSNRIVGDFEIPATYDGAAVTEIERAAFIANAGLISVVVPEGVEIIGNSAFSSCFSLERVVLPSTVKSIGVCAFASCRKLKEVKIPDGVTEIADETFEFCTELASVELPAGLTRIGNKAFYACVGLKTIKYGGTEEQWAEIVKGAEWDYTAESYTVIYNYANQ